MRILADESVDGPVVYRLRSDGLDVTYVAEIAAGISDKEVLALAALEVRLLLTADRDFGDLVFRLEQDSPGVVLLRLAGMPNEAKAVYVATVISRFERQLPGSFSVLTRRALRVRRANNRPAPA